MPARRFSAGHTARYRIELTLMLLPFLLGVLVLICIPVVATFAMAFVTYDSVSPPEWNNFRNFPEIFSERLFWVSTRNSLIFVGLAVPLRLLGALALALLFRRRRRGVGLYRVAAYLPTVIPDAAYALIWLVYPKRLRPPKVLRRRISVSVIPYNNLFTTARNG